MLPEHQARSSSLLANAGSGVLIVSANNILGSTLPDTANTIAFNGSKG